MAFHSSYKCIFVRYNIVWCQANVYNSNNKKTKLNQSNLRHISCITIHIITQQCFLTFTLFNQKQRHERECNHKSTQVPGYFRSSFHIHWNTCDRLHPPVWSEYIENWADSSTLAIAAVLVGNIIANITAIVVPANLTVVALLPVTSGHGWYRHDGRNQKENRQYNRRHLHPLWNVSEIDLYIS